MADWTVLAPDSGSVSERLAEKLARMIRRGELADGARIPSERELSEIAGISRTSVREALRDLELRGLVDRRRGRGTVLTTRERLLRETGPGAAAAPADRGVREVVDLRSLIEPPMAERAATRARAGEVEALGRSVEAAEEEASRPEPVLERLLDLDVAFHVTIARLTHNRMLVRLLEVAEEWVAPSRAVELQAPGRLRASVAAHRSIYEAVRARDAAAAHLAMARHIDEISGFFASDALR